MYTGQKNSARLHQLKKELLEVQEELYEKKLNFCMQNIKKESERKTYRGKKQNCMI